MKMFLGLLILPALLILISLGHYVLVRKFEGVRFVNPQIIERLK